MLLPETPRVPRASVGALATVLGVALAASLAAFFALLAPAAPPAQAIGGGQDSATLDGQVQFYEASGSGRIGDPFEYECAGTLIDPGWVLTAKHCITDVGATPATSGVLVGDRRLGQGDPHTLESIHLDPGTDSALLELEDPVSNDSYVVGYVAGSTPAVGQNVAIRGWGSPGTGPPRPFLQVATMSVAETRWAGAVVGDRLLLGDIGQGVPERGDSGAGVYAGGRVQAVLSGGDAATYATAVPTADIAGWIQQVSNVAPSIYPALDTPNVPGEPPAAPPASAPAAPPLPDSLLTPNVPD